MKKKTLVLLALFSLFLVTGCGEKTKELAPIDVLTKTMEKLGEAKSLEVAANVKAKYSEDGISVDIDVPFIVSVATDEESFDMKVLIDKNSFMDRVEAYVSGNTKEKNFNAYFPSTLFDSMMEIESDEVEWLHYGMSLEDLDLDTDTADLEKLNNLDYKKIIGDNFVYVDTTDNVKHYQFVINQDLFGRLATELGETLEDDMKFEGDFKVDFYIDKDYNLVKMVMDFKQFMDLMDDEEMMMFDEFSATIEIKNVNNTTVTIPEEIKNNATDFEEYLENLYSMEDIY